MPYSIESSSADKKKPEEHSLHGDGNVSDFYSCQNYLKQELAQQNQKRRPRIPETSSQENPEEKYGQLFFSGVSDKYRHPVGGQQGN